MILHDCPFKEHRSAGQRYAIAFEAFRARVQNEHRAHLVKTELSEMFTTSTCQRHRAEIMIPAGQATRTRTKSRHSQAEC